MSALVSFVVFATTFLRCFAAIMGSTHDIPASFMALSSEENSANQHCWLPQIPKISNASSIIYENIKQTLGEERYKSKSIARFQGAIGVDTQANDDFGSVKTDERWSKFYRFSEFLKKEFPLVHKNLQLERINYHGLLYTWTPSFEKTKENHPKKPFLLMAHQDTVPVSNESIADWKFDPFAGRIDNSGIMYGRGVHDDKNSLISILEAVELLLNNKFKPNRPLLLAFGFDEEVSGTRGALEISQFLQQRYGKHSIEFILDEGPGIVDQSLSGGEIAYATVATAEKGYLDVSIEAKVPGGHSSLAEKHSLIGIVAEMIMSLENKYPFLPRVSKKNPLLGFLSCQRFHDQEIPLLLNRIRDGDETAEYELGFLLQNSSISALTHTSQAIDLISGGQKINALPERVSVGINYRITPDSSLKEIKGRICDILKPVALKYDMDCSFFNDEENLSSSDRFLRVSQIGRALEPAKMSPQGSKSYSIIFGTVISALEPFYTEAMSVKSLAVVPTLMAGNTDTRHYWNLTENLFRFRPTRIDERNNGGHTVNEHLHAGDHFAAVQFYAALILNASEM